MAISRKPEADKLPVSQRINQRMENPKRRQATPTDWAIKGELFLNCSCTVFCPCVVSLGAHPPTEGHCHAWMAIAIDEGYYEEENLAGIDVGLLVDIPGRMGEGDWKVAAYIDSIASGKAYNGLLRILSGDPAALGLYEPVNWVEHLVSAHCNTVGVTSCSCAALHGRCVYTETVFASCADWNRALRQARERWVVHCARIQ